MMSKHDEAELRSLKKNLSTDAEPSADGDPIHMSRSKLDPCKMKYSQACVLKKQVDSSIDKLTKSLMGVNLTDMARVRLAVVHVSTYKLGVLALAKSDVGQHVGTRGTGQRNGLGLGCR